MQLTFLPPPPDLRSLVVTFWHLRADGDPAVRRPRQRVVPDGYPELILHLHTPPRRPGPEGLEVDPRLFVFGQLTRFLDLVPGPSTFALGARLHPTALARLAGEAAHRLADRPISLDDLWGARGRRLEERLLATPDPVRALDLLSSELRRRTAGLVEDATSSTTRFAIERIRSRRGTEPIADLARALDCSPRQLERRFRELIGIPPKTYARIVRFHAAQRQSESAPNWSRVAADLGFADQSHLIRDFQRFAGQSPLVFERSSEVELARRLGGDPGIG